MDTKKSILKSSSLNKELASTGWRVVRLFLLLAAVVIVGTVGYVVLMHWSWLDSLYMTVITLTTVGFGEVKPMGDGGRLFTIFLLFTSMGIVAYSATTLAAMVMETEFSLVIWRRKMEKQIKQMEGHIIVCGFGRTGSAVCDTLVRSRQPFVVLETRPEGLERLRELGWPLVDGDATLDESLERANIGRASALVAALGNDAENVYLILSARQMNPALRIAAWASSMEAEVKVMRAGANYVVSPYLLGGSRLVQHLISPHTLDFLDRATKGEDPNIRLDELIIPSGSPFHGNSLSGLGVGRNLGVIVVGIRRRSEMIFNPPATTHFEEGDILICIGSQDQLATLRKMVQ